VTRPPAIGCSTATTRRSIGSSATNDRTERSPEPRSEGRSDGNDLTAETWSLPLGDHEPPDPWRRARVEQRGAHLLALQRAVERAGAAERPCLRAGRRRSERGRCDLSMAGRLARAACALGTVRAARARHRGRRRRAHRRRDHLVGRARAGRHRRAAHAAGDRGAHRRLGRRVAFDDTTGAVLTVGSDGYLRTWSTAGALRSERRITTREIYGLDVRGGRAVTASADGGVLLIDLATGQLVRRFRGHEAAVLTVRLRATVAG
jgi:hypothetical protein